LENWWTPQTTKQFQDKAECIVKQYGSYEALPGLFLRGRFVEQENIADNGGTHLSYIAFKKQIGNELYSPSPVVGLTNEQLFFVSYAQQWCFKMTDDYTRFWVLTNQHSVPHLRVRGVISNMEPFGPAFQCPVGSTYNPKHKCRVW
jgi:predicted metalloendopeptidase